MLTIYRRHRKACAHRSEGREYRCCKCPIWADGFLAGQEIRKSLGTRDWEKAQDTIREWEAKGAAPLGVVTEEQPVTIQELKTAFLENAKGRKLKDSTIDRYRIIFRQLERFAQDKVPGTSRN